MKQKLEICSYVKQKQYGNSSSYVHRSGTSKDLPSPARGLVEVSLVDLLVGSLVEVLLAVV